MRNAWNADAVVTSFGMLRLGSDSWMKCLNLRFLDKPDDGSDGGIKPDVVLDGD
jgi:hypothetical protein